jgi:hypothetical protein
MTQWLRRAESNAMRWVVQSRERRRQPASPAVRCSASRGTEAPAVCSSGAVRAPMRRCSAAARRQAGRDGEAQRSEACASVSRLLADNCLISQQLHIASFSLVCRAFHSLPVRMQSSIVATTVGQRADRTTVRPASACTGADGSLYRGLTHDGSSRVDKSQAPLLRSLSAALHR